MAQRAQPELVNLADSVSLLKQDMAQVGTLVDRLDVTIEKLTEVSSTVSQILAVQGSRLEFQEKVHVKLEEIVEKRREETEKYVKDLYGKIDTVERELQVDMEDNKDKVLAKIEQLRVEGQEQHKDMEKRLTRLEKWMWTVVGGGAVIGFVISRIPWAAFIG